MVRAMMRGRLRGWLAAGVCGAMGVASAAGDDPTRPPSAILQPDAGLNGTGDLRLQSVVFGAGRRIALINDKAYRVGQSVGEYKLLAISETSVRLRGADGERVLHWVEGVNKTYPASKTGKSSKEKVQQ